VSVLVVVVDDEPHVAELSRRQFRRDLRTQRFVMDFAISAVDALARIGAVGTNCCGASVCSWHEAEHAQASAGRLSKGQADVRQTSSEVSF
jgi:hypothetical protein